ARARGAAVSRVRSSGDAYTAEIRGRTPSAGAHAARRSPSRAACCWPASDRCRPGARPGSNCPVLGVVPWRTSNTSVDGAALGLALECAWGLGGVAICPCQPSVSGMKNGQVGSGRDALGRLESEIVACRACPRLVAWREEVAVTRRAAFRDEVYWARPVPGF